jgi:REP element-mobilizing transposase RayT
MIIEVPMRSAKQDLLPGFGQLGVKEFGGSSLKGNAHEQRPIAVKRSIHLVMKSSLARGEQSFLSKKRAKRIEDLIYRQGNLHGVKVYRFANSGNHLHLLIQPISRKAFLKYVRAISGLIARITLGAKKGKALGLKFWDARPFTRIIEWGRDFRNVCNYVLQNTLEAIGFIPYQPRGRQPQKKAPAPT